MVETILFAYLENITELLTSSDALPYITHLHGDLLQVVTMKGPQYKSQLTRKPAGNTITKFSCDEQYPNTVDLTDTNGKTDLHDENSVNHQKA